MKKIFIIFTSIVVSFGLYTAITFAEPQAADEGPNQPDYLKLISPNKLKEDLDFLFKTIEEVHPNMYAYTSKEEFSKYRDKLYHQINRPMNRIEFFKLTAPVVAELKNSHTSIMPNVEEFRKYDYSGGKVFPLALRWDGSSVILAENHSSAELPLGATVLRINQEPAAKILRQFAQCVAPEGKSGGNPQVEVRPDFFALLLWFEYGPLDSWDVRMKTKDGKVSNHTIKPVAFAKLKSGKFTAVNSYHHISGYNTGLITLKEMCSPVPREKFEEYTKFLNTTFKEIQNSKISNLIIDIRDNPGGSSMAADELLNHLTDKAFRQYEQVQTKMSPYVFGNEHNVSCVPNTVEFRAAKIGSVVTEEIPFTNQRENPLRFTGRTFVLTGPMTASSASSFACAIKCFSIATIVGRETGEPTTGYGNYLNFTLPNSNLLLRVACKYYVNACGKPDGRGVIPDYEVKQKLEDTAKGVDTVMQFTLNLIKDPDFGIEQKADNQIQIERTEK